MDRKVFVIALLVAIPLLFVSPVAKASDIVTNQWYSAAFGYDIPSPVSGPADETGYDGPVLPSGTADSINAPDGTIWTVTLSGSGTLTVTDLEDSGDQFQVWDNGNAMALAPSPFITDSGQAGLISDGNSYTSTPCVGCDYVGEDIGAALSSADFSSGTFALSSGVNNITIDYIGVVGGGDMAFIAEGATSPVPEPSSLALLGAGLAGLLVTFRRKLMA